MQNWTRWRHNAEVCWIVYRLNHAAWMLVTDADLCFSLDIKQFTLLILFFCNILGVNTSHLGKQTHTNCIFGRCLHIFLQLFSCKACLHLFVLMAHLWGFSPQSVENEQQEGKKKTEWSLLENNSQFTPLTYSSPYLNFTERKKILNFSEPK